MANKSRPSLGWRLARGGAFTIVALFVGCYACTKTDAWERFNGSTTGQGIHDLTARGVVALDWHNLPAHAARTSELAGEDGYDIELSGPSEYQFLAFKTPTRPSPGTYRVSTSPSRGYEAMLMLSSSLTVEGRDVNFVAADSGRVTLRSAQSGLDGAYTVYFTGTPPTDLNKHGQVVVSGTFHLR